MPSAVASSTIIVFDHCTCFHHASIAKGKVLTAKSVITLDDEVRAASLSNHSVQDSSTSSADTIDMGTCQVPGTAEGYTLTVNCIPQKSSWSLGKILFMFVSTESESSLSRHLSARRIDISVWPLWCAYARPCHGWRRVTENPIQSEPLR